MSSGPSENDGIELPASRQASDAATEIVDAAPHGDFSIPREPRWGFWATVGFSLVVLVAFLGLQTVVAIGFVLVQVVNTGRLPNPTEAEALTSNGLLLSLSALVSMPPCLALAALFAKLKRGATIRGYLGLRSAPLWVACTWLGVTLLYVAAADGLTYALARPIVPAVIATAYSTAGFLPLLWIALVVMAPVFEESFFRGCMLEGFRHTRLRASLQNIIATIETAVYVHLQGNAA